MAKSRQALKPLWQGTWAAKEEPPGHTAFGRVDIVVNNAGIIQVGPMSTTTVEDFATALDVMFWGALYPTLAVLPQMRARRSGHVVNITSIGGMVSVPHLLPYTCAKFAAVGLSEGLRTELGQEGIHVTTVVPGWRRSDIIPKPHLPYHRVHASNKRRRMSSAIRSMTLYSDGVLAYL